MSDNTLPVRTRKNRAVLPVLCLLIGAGGGTGVNILRSSDGSNITVVVADPLVTEVIKAVDGDTGRVLYDPPLQSTDLRLVGIDTPERGQDGYEQAKVALSELMSDSVRIEFAGGDDKDVYGRLLVWVWTADGLLVQEELIRQGHTDAVDRWGKPTPYWERLVTAQAERDSVVADVAGEVDPTPEPVTDVTEPLPSI